LTAKDASFAALADPTRLGILERLGRSDASISDLATRFDMTLTGMKRHVQVLEDARLVTTEKVVGCGPAARSIHIVRTSSSAWRSSAADTGASSSTHRTARTASRVVIARSRRSRS